MGKALTGVRLAHSEGEVWIECMVNGGSVKTPGPKAHGIGKMTIKGPMSPAQSFVLWMAAKGNDPCEIAEEVARYTKEGGDPTKPPTLKPLLEAVRDMLGGVGDEIPLAFVKLREAWIAAKTPGL